MKRGKLIVFEGISGTGKETQAKLLQEYLKNKGIPSMIVYHPSPDLKEILARWRKARGIDYMTEAYLLLADRYDHVRRIIHPALAKGQWVISLRNWVSALVYQGKSQKDRKFLYSEFSRFEPKVDTLFYFDIQSEEAYRRIHQRLQLTGEQLGKFETLSFLKQKRSAYQPVLRLIPHVTIDASKEIRDIRTHVIGHMVQKYRILP